MLVIGKIKKKKKKRKTSESEKCFKTNFGYATGESDTFACSKQIIHFSYK